MRKIFFKSAYMLILISFVILLFLINTFALGEAVGITSQSYYYLENQNSGLYLDATSDGSLIQYPFHGDENQQFQLIYNSPGYYTITPRRYPGQVLDVNTANNYINLFSSHNGTNQQWNVIKNGNGSYRLLSRCSSSTQAAVILNASTSPYAPLIHHQYNNSGNDNWIFEPVGGRLDGSERYYTSVYGGDAGIDPCGMVKESDVLRFVSNASTLGFPSGFYSNQAQRKKLLGRISNGSGSTILYWSGHSLNGLMSYYDQSIYIIYKWVLGINLCWFKHDRQQFLHWVLHKYCMG